MRSTLPGNSASASRQRRTLRLALALVAAFVCFALAAWGVWQLGARDRRPFDPQLQTNPDALLAALLPLPPGERAAALVVFWDEGCSCSPAAFGHLRALAQQYLPRGVRVLLVPGPRVDDPEAARAALGDGVELLRRDPTVLGLPAAPAAAVLDASGSVQYLGPLSENLSCSADAGGPVEVTLEQVLGGSAEPYINLLGTGCLCEWGTAAD